MAGLAGRPNMDHDGMYVVCIIVSSIAPATGPLGHWAINWAMNWATHCWATNWAAGRTDL